MPCCEVRLTRNADTRTMSGFHSLKRSEREQPGWPMLAGKESTPTALEDAKRQCISEFAFGVRAIVLRFSHVSQPHYEHPPPQFFFGACTFVAHPNWIAPKRASDVQRPLASLDRAQIDQLVANDGALCHLFVLLQVCIFLEGAKGRHGKCILCINQFLNQGFTSDEIFRRILNT